MNHLPDSTDARDISGARRLMADWSRPLVDHAVAHLASGWSNALLDLSSILVVVPTRHAGRRLREALALHTAGAGAVVPPTIVTPEFLVSPERLADGDRVASPAQCLVAWIDVLRSIDTQRFRGVFPVDPVERSFAWALHTASRLMDLRGTLAEAALTIGDAAARLSLDDVEPRRWRELAGLEALVLEKLGASGLLDPESTRIRAAREGALPAGIDRIAVIGVADPLPLCLVALERHARALPVEILVHAPADLSDLFDAWGRPIPGAWKSRAVDIPDPAQTVIPAPDPTGQAAAVAALLDSLGEGADATAISLCVPDAEVEGPLRKMLVDRGIGAFEPAGRPLATHEFFFLLSTLWELIATRSAASFAELIRCPDLALALAGGDEGEVPRLLRFFDKLQAQHLPDTVDDIAAMLGRFHSGDGARAPRAAFETLCHWLERLQGEPLAAALPEFLGFAYSRRLFRSDRPADRVYAAAAEALARRLADMERAPLEATGNPERLELLLHLLQGERIDSERSPADIDLQGWLEIFWEDAPRVAICGFNEGRVPRSVAGDPWLPNSALARLGLRDNEHWLARDAYYLTAVIESRRGSGGGVHIVFGRACADGTPLRPSRLLFHCRDEELPGRVRQLFRETASPGSGPAGSGTAAWSRTWLLKPPALPPGNPLGRRLRVTDFKSFLECPTRFYLSRGLGMSETDPSKMEMDPKEFGELCHGVLARFARECPARDSDDEDEIRRHLLEDVEARVAWDYGDRLTVPLMIQLESARGRLSKGAAVQAALRREGWKIECAEWSLDVGSPWTIDGMPIGFGIDRIDRHEKTGALRVIDYKTSASPVPPAKAHLAAFARKAIPEGTREWALFRDADGAAFAWTDLQLPLYVHALRERWPGAGAVPIECAYFNLPRAVGATGLAAWEDLDESRLQSAMSCARSVIAAVRAFELWPPSQRRHQREDAFEILFEGDAAKAIDGDDFRRILASQAGTLTL